MTKQEIYAKDDLYKFAGEEAMRAAGDDPRLATQAAEISHRHSYAGHFETVAHPRIIEIPMEEGKPCNVR